MNHVWVFQFAKLLSPNCWIYRKFWAAWIWGSFIVFATITTRALPSSHHCCSANNHHNHCFQDREHPYSTNSLTLIQTVEFSYKVIFILFQTCHSQFFIQLYLSLWILLMACFLWESFFTSWAFVLFLFASVSSSFLLFINLPWDLPVIFSIYSGCVIVDFYNSSKKKNDLKLSLWKKFPLPSFCSNRVYIFT